MKHVAILVPLGHTSLTNIEGTHQILSEVNRFRELQGKSALFNIQLVGSTGSSARNIGSSYRASYRDVYLVEDGKIKELNTFVIDTV